ncbi:uncharacterized protein KY384_002092 [Bacidia gigantensis]|uniref:uncharacterized protein n=1 Tax=Bacidia gigantensis TaxID=2732470 RepID=UPI001D03AE08|nr:uncharacterized protein KY384_002092 [Bacidia gigantensis]KAG8533309.1 hypothetical protein KY384_002092 [Bacidia gigantensis]
MAPDPASISPISISPLLKQLVAHAPVIEKEIDAARLLIYDERLSLAQKSLFFALLKARGHDLNELEYRLLEQCIEDTPPDGYYISIASVLRKLLDPGNMEDGQATADEIADAVGIIFENRLVVAQCSLLLGLLAYTCQDRDPVVLAKVAEEMMAAAEHVETGALHAATSKVQRSKGRYEGGLCDIVGTGGDGHSTFNVSTTASIIASSSLLISKHGNRASSSTSGSADLLQSIPPEAPDIEAVTSQTLPFIYENSSYAFLFAPIFHPGMRHVATIRKNLGIRTIFNVIGPLANPVGGAIEARVVGVAEKSMGRVYAEALRLSGARKALVVCGAENLDEISCAGKTYCWHLFEDKENIRLEQFELEPADFGLPAHPLSDVAGGKLPHENANFLVSLLKNKLTPDDPILHFVLMNTAALFATSGICEDDEGQERNGFAKADEVITERGPGGQRWKEGIRLARKAIESGAALESLDRFIEATRRCSDTQ